LKKKVKLSCLHPERKLMLLGGESNFEKKKSQVRKRGACRKGERRRKLVNQILVDEVIRSSSVSGGEGPEEAEKAEKTRKKITRTEKRVEAIIQHPKIRGD